MKIIAIFAEQLYAFVYQEYSENEYDRLMNLWTDVNYLKKYAETNRVLNVHDFIKNRLKDAEDIQDLLQELTQSNEPLGKYFRPLNDYEIGCKELSLQKGKVSKKDGLRLYAIKIDDDCFVITGGAIKMSQAMQEHPDTANELKKIQQAQYFLKDNGVIDKASFYEFRNEIE